MSLQKEAEKRREQDESKRAARGLSVPVLATSLVLVLVSTLQWTRRWLYSGCAVESLLIVYGYGTGSRILPSVHLWTLLASVNLIYAVCSTSWLLYGFFTAVCYPCVLFTCLTQSTMAANLVRRSLRRWLRQLHFTRDKIALFDLPALELDTDVDGLFVVRGITISLSSLTIVAHGIELGIKLADDIELAISLDEVSVALFRRIQIGEVYANLKGGKIEMTFAELDELPDTAGDDDSVFVEATPLLRAATAGSEGFKDRPKLRESLTGVHYMKDSSAKAVLDPVTLLSPDDKQAETQYLERLKEIRATSAVGQSRARVRENSQNDGSMLEEEADMRAAVCAELHELPSVPHPPSRSVRVTTLQNLTSPKVRDFVARLPFLLRLLLAPLSYLHTISISSITAGGSGRWLSELLSQNVFKHYTDSSAEIRRLEAKVSAWLEKANFCGQLTNITGLGQVPLGTDMDISVSLKFKDIIAYRTLPETSTTNQVIRLGGADATFTVPVYFLPHHEHIVPPRPTQKDEQDLKAEIQDAEGKPNTIHAQRELEKAQKDESGITITAHGSLPACFDQSLLNFIAAIVKVTKIIELEKVVDEVELQNGQSEDVETPISPECPQRSFTVDSETLSIKSAPGSPKKNARFKDVARKIQHNMKETTATTGQSIKEFAKDLHQTTRDGMKKAVVVGVINDGWIAKMVGKVAAKLEQAEGSLGYSGTIPVPLEPYRLGADQLPTKLLP